MDKEQQSKLELDVQNLKIKNGDLILLKFNEGHRTIDYLAAICKFEQMCGSYEIGDLRLWIGKPVEIYSIQKSELNGIGVPKIGHSSGSRVYSVGSINEIKTGAEEILKGLEADERLKPYFAWFEQFLKKQT